MWFIFNIKIEPSMCVRYIPNCVSYLETSDGLQCGACAGDLTMASGSYVLSTGICHLWLDKKSCLPRIPFCSVQVDLKCTVAQTGKMVVDGGVSVCTSCGLGTSFAQGKCASDCVSLQDKSSDKDNIIGTSPTCDCTGLHANKCCKEGKLYVPGYFN